MPNPEDYRPDPGLYDPNAPIPTNKDGLSVAEKQDRARRTMGKMEKKGKGPMPTPDKDKGEDMMSPAYRERLRSWRETPDDEPASPRAAAVKTMLKKQLD